MTSAQPESTSAPLVAASSTLALVHYLERQGVLNAPRVEQLTGLAMSELTDPDRRVPADAHYRLWEHAELVTGDPGVGLHAGQVVDPERMGLVGHVFFNCDTLGEAVTQYVRLHRLINESVFLSFEQTADQAILCWQPDRAEHYCRQDMDRTLAASITRTRHFIHPGIRAEWVEIAHPAPVYADEYEKLLGGPVRFDCGITRLAFSSRHLGHPIPRRNPYVYSAVLKQVNSLLARLQTRRSFGRKIRRLISKQMATEKIDADTLARQCHMSRQTLYRKLKKEGLSFHGLVEQVRQDKALRYVAADQYALGEIAFLLGFSELSAFSRAFKRWTGTSPAEYRARHLATSDADHQRPGAGDGEQ
ncbi:MULTISPECIES: AraC family transcriptional regulator [unclassified Marinobacter]|uniref:AraC family transcriptional regulator n=1 Tax=unclassified Marinobacter TaxID=83889 RepID=UPI001928F9BE|nr:MULTISPECIES: AraC family transcriptional regulator [unclassified Marinobacter]MBL3826144.1 AraC family transcriptional regulator [Marinobacter sp. MC3]MBL3894650.1 AraC family transcriptional regulator [Marinobacter sp. MW3]